MTQLAPSDIQAADLTPKGWRDSSQDFVLAIDNTNGRAVYAGYPADVTITSWVGDTQLAEYVYVPNLGYKRQILPFDFKRGALAGWYASTLSAKNISLFLSDQVPALEGAVGAPARDCANIKANADAEITRLRSIYGRGAQVPEDRIVTHGLITLKGFIYAEMAKANQDARNKGCPDIPFPEAAGASTSAGLNFPPPDGTIQLGTGEVPIGVLLNDITTPTRNEGPWPVGSHSAYTAPANAFRGGQPAPAPFRFPNPQLWYGPAGTYTGLNPESGLPVSADPGRDSGTQTPRPPVAGTGGPTPAPSGPPAVSGPIPPMPTGGVGGGGGTVAVSGPPVGSTLPPGVIRDSSPPRPPIDGLPSLTPDPATVSTVSVPAPKPAFYVLAGVLVLGMMTYLLTRKG
jgi:hypothetical protein